MPAPQVEIIGVIGSLDKTCEQDIHSPEGEKTVAIALVNRYDVEAKVLINICIYENSLVLQPRKQLKEVANIYLNNLC